MIIVSQGKNEIINFENIDCIAILNPLEDNEGKFRIIAKTPTDEYILGKYKQEDVAKDILNNIYVRRCMFEYFKSIPSRKFVQGEIEKDFEKDDVIFDCFEMPEEGEDESL